MLPRGAPGGVPRTAEAVAPGNLVDMQIRGPASDPSEESETLQVGCAKPSKDLWRTLKGESRCSR